MTLTTTAVKLVALQTAASVMRVVWEGSLGLQPTAAHTLGAPADRTRVAQVELEGKAARVHTEATVAAPRSA
jgi:hypothetical protein